MKKESIPSKFTRKYGEDAKIDLTDIETKIESLTLDFIWQPSYEGHDIVIEINGNEIHDVSEICKPNYVRNMHHESKPLQKVLKKFFSKESVEKIKKDCPNISNLDNIYVTTGIDFTWNSYTHNLIDAEIGFGT